MSDTDPDDVKLQLKLLRDQVARLVTENLDLRRQLLDLQRSRADASVESLAANTLRSIDRAEQQINAQVPAGRRYAISGLEASFKGLLVPRQGRLEFQAPIPEYSNDTGHLSSVHMTFAQVPTLTQAASPSAASDDQTLFRHLERLQADFLSWRYPETSPEASDVVARSAYLLSMPGEWAAAAFTKGLLALSESLLRFAKAIQPVFTPAAVKAYQDAASALLRLASSLVEKGGLNPVDLPGLSAALEQLLLAYQALQ